MAKVQKIVGNMLVKLFYLGHEYGMLNKKEVQYPLMRETNSGSGSEFQPPVWFNLWPGHMGDTHTLFL